MCVNLKCRISLYLLNSSRVIVLLVEPELVQKLLGEIGIAPFGEFSFQAGPSLRFVSEIAFYCIDALIIVRYCSTQACYEFSLEGICLFT